MRAFCFAALSWLACGSVVAGPEEFRLIQITVAVRDPQGQPVAGAQVRVYSEDWHMRFPREKACGVADAQGRYTVTVPVGRYSLFAGSPAEYTDSHSGQGLFVVKSPVDIRDSCEVALQPDSLIRVKATTLDGSPLPVGRLLACESTHVPVVYQPQVGVVRNGRIDLATSRGCKYLLVVHSLYEEGPVGYFLGEANVPVGTDLWLRGDQSNRLARLRVEVYDRNNQPSKAVVRFDFPELCIDRQYHAPEVKGARDYLITPTLLRLLYDMRDERGSCVSLPRYVRLRAGQQTRIQFGGRIDPAVLVPSITTDFGYTEFILDPKDAFGNHLQEAKNVGGQFDLPLTILEKGQPVARDRLRVEGAPWVLSGYMVGVPDPTQDLDYLLSLNLFPLGQYDLRGRLSPNLKWQETRAGPFSLFTPPGCPAQASLCAELISRISAAQSEVLGTEPPSPGVLPVWIKPNPLQAANGRRHVSAMFLNEFLALEPDAVDLTLLWVLTHEIGHAMQWEGDKTAPGWYVGFDVEAEANLLALAARMKLFPERLAWYDTGDLLDDQVFKRWESGETPTETFAHNLVEFYTLKRYGWQPHRRNHRIGWLRKGDYERLIGTVGLTKWEAMDSVLSYLCGEDLSWLYGVSGLTVEGRRVGRGVKLLAVNRLSLGYPTSRVVICGSPGERVSVPLRLANNTEKSATVRLGLTPAPGGWNDRTVPLPGEGTAEVLLEAGQMPQDAGELSVGAIAEGGLANRMTCALVPVKSLPVTDGSAMDTFPCLLPTRRGLVLAWERGNSVAVAKLDGSGKLSASQVVTEPQSLFPRLLELEEGRLWLAYDASREGAGNIFYRESRDGGTTWSEERQITFEKPYVTCGPALAEDSSGAVWLACSNGITISRDGGRSWSPPRPIKNMDNAWLNLIPLRNNRMLAMIGFRSFDISTSGDAGATWQPFRTIDAYPRPSANPTYPYPYLTRGGSGKLHLVYNSDRGGNSLWYRCSSDDGETWGDLVRVASGEDVCDGSSVAEVEGQVWVAWAKRTNAGSELLLSVVGPATIPQ